MSAGDPRCFACGSMMAPSDVGRWSCVESTCVTRGERQYYEREFVHPRPPFDPKSCAYARAGGPCITNPTVPRAKWCLACRRAHAELTGTNPPLNEFTYPTPLDPPASIPIPTPDWATHREAQARADSAGVPVKLTITAIVLGQPGPSSTVWVEPIASIGQWVIIREPDGTEVPVRKAAAP